MCGSILVFVEREFLEFLSLNDDDDDETPQSYSVPAIAESEH